MASTSKKSVQKCLNCAQTATHTCKACKVMPNATDGQLSSAWYCGAECQKAHWTEHKPQCKATQARQILYHVGDLAQKLFYVFSKTTNMFCPWRMEKMGTTWLLHPIVYNNKSRLVPFQSTAFPSVRDQEALLCYQRCSNAVFTMHNIVKILLHGLYSKIDEVNHFVKGAKHHLRRVYPNEGIDGTDYTHTVIRVTIKNGESYVIDMAGAQYGWYDPVIPWQLYHTSRVREIRDVMPFGGTTMYWKSKANNPGFGVGIMEAFALEMDYAVVWWQRHNVPLSDLLRLPEHEFQGKKASLLNSFDEMLQLSRAIRESRGEFENREGFKHGAERAFEDRAPGMAFTLLRDGFFDSGVTPSG